MTCVVVAVVVKLALFTGDVPTKYIAAGLVAVLLLSLAWMEQEDERRQLQALPEEIARSVLEAQKQSFGEGLHPAVKWAYIAWKRE